MDTDRFLSPKFPNIISIVKPTICTSVSNLFYFGMTLYMFRTVFPSIISSSRLYIQQQTDTAARLLASRQLYLFDVRRNSSCQCSLFSNKNPIIRIFSTSVWLVIPINPDNRTYTVVLKAHSEGNLECRLSK